MTRILLFALTTLLFQATSAQQPLRLGMQTASPSKPLEWGEEMEKPKPINYSTVGYLAPLKMKDLVIGGTSVVYKRFGTFLTYKVGVLNWMMPDGGVTRGDITYANAKKNGFTITNNEKMATTFMLSGGIAFCIWKKMPIYVGIGATRYRVFFEYLDPWDNNKAKWNVNTDKTGFQLNYSAGFVLPLFWRLILNAGYDHNPQSVFIGIGFRSKEAYKDIDEWK